VVDHLSVIGNGDIGKVKGRWDWAYSRFWPLSLSGKYYLRISTLEIVMILGSIIEPLMAPSIVYVAIENIWGKVFIWRWVIALVFGLVHRLGFAEILSGKLRSKWRY
jgi:hypothetical protein